MISKLALLVISKLVLSSHGGPDCLKPAQCRYANALWLDDKVYLLTRLVLSSHGGFRIV